MQLARAIVEMTPCNTATEKFPPSACDRLRKPVEKDRCAIRCCNAALRALTMFQTPSQGEVWCGSYGRKGREIVSPLVSVIGRLGAGRMPKVRYVGTPRNLIQPSPLLNQRLYGCPCLWRTNFKSLRSPQDCTTSWQNGKQVFGSD